MYVYIETLLKRCTTCATWQTGQLCFSDKISLKKLLKKITRFGDCTFTGEIYAAWSMVVSEWCICWTPEHFPTDQYEDMSKWWLQSMTKLRVRKACALLLLEHSRHRTSFIARQWISRHVNGSTESDSADSVTVQGGVIREMHWGKEAFEIFFSLYFTFMFIILP